MNANNVPAVALTDRSPMTQTATRSRTTFIDNLRVALTALVVFQHAAIQYGASGAWYYHEEPEGSNLVLTLFAVANQAFFMGFFFLVAGYFTPGALDRKGPLRFMADRMLRLGLPWLVFGFILNSLTVALAQGHSVGGIFTSWAQMLARGQFGNGPLWFAEALLAFSAVYAAWRVVVGRIGPTERALPGHVAMLIAALLVGASAFLVRLIFPAGMTVSDLMLGAFPAYIVLYAVGVIGARGKWLEHVPAQLARPWLIVSILVLLLFMSAVVMTGTSGYAGGWNARAASYAFFEPFFAWGVILGLLWLFHSYFNSPTARARFLSARAYTVYVIHPPVLVVVARSMSSWVAPALTKFLVAGALGCVASVAVASLVLLVPGARRVL
jgi:peptidoglycan/LPS O-acetylase OafA/YrhL